MDEAPDPSLPGLPVLSELPPPVPRVLLGWAAAAVGAMPEASVPPSLVRVRRFMPTKRVTAGEAMLTRALQQDSVFRAEVLCQAPAAPAGPEATAAAWLRGDLEQFLQSLPGLQVAETALPEVSSVTERDRARAELVVLRRRLTAQEGQTAKEREGAALRLAELQARVRPLQQRLTSSQREAQRLGVEVQRLSAELAELERSAAAVTAQLQARLRRVEADLASLRASASVDRAAVDQRVVLLLDTVAGAAQGLRRELGVLADGPLPGDLVDAGQRGDARAGGPANLDALLALPRVHVIVDGYNVTKGSWGSLSLEDQRRRLISGAAALVARTGAELTLVFDGQGRIAPPVTAGRGVRVVFTDPGELADTVILTFAAAEPAGRPVVVVSSDREVADGAASRGAWSVPSAELAALMR
jgi:predicted RNA-binding protein with PIN domain